MRQSLMTIDEARREIATGRPLLIAADEAALAQLPAGRWIAGSIPYFMAEAGGTTSRSQVFVTELPPEVLETEIRTYDATSLRELYKHAPANGFTVLVIAAGSDAHTAFALEAPTYDGFGTHPVVGWIAGVHLDDLGKASAKVVDGRAAAGDRMSAPAVAMHVALPPTRAVDVGILNLFKQGDGDKIMFEHSGFEVRDALINGERKNFAAYIREKGLDTRCPIVSDYYGVGINVSIQAVEDDRVVFYAPVFDAIEYRHASPVADYVSEFTAQMPKDGDIAFACNCILNYLYSGLEGRKTEGVLGPVTFGEIAYQLLNQTLVYMTLVDVAPAT